MVYCRVTLHPGLDMGVDNPGFGGFVNVLWHEGRPLSFPLFRGDPREME